MFVFRVNSDTVCD